jgi:hypothetical protein
VPDRHFWQNALLQVNAHVRHSPCDATWTPATFAARKGNQLRVATAAAFQMKATFFEDPTIQELLKLGHHELRQPTAFLHPLSKRWPMLGDRLVQNRLLRSTSLVAVDTPSSARQWQLNSSLAHAATAASRVPSSIPRDSTNFTAMTGWRRRFSPLASPRFRQPLATTSAHLLAPMAARMRATTCGRADSTSCSDTRSTR